MFYSSKPKPTVTTPTEAEADATMDEYTGPFAMNIATISAGFEKGDFLVREEQGNRVYFDFFEEVSRTKTSMTTICLVPAVQDRVLQSFSRSPSP